MVSLKKIVIVVGTAIFYTFCNFMYCCRSPILETEYKLTNDELKKLGKEVVTFFDEIQKGSIKPGGDVGVCTTMSCGFGCTFHSFVSCSYRALQQGKGFRLIENDKSSLNMKAWGEVFYRNIHELQEKERGGQVENNRKRGKPIPTSQDSNDVNSSHWNINTAPITAIHLKGIPQSVHDKVNLLHSNPTAWWIGQLASYLLKLKPEHQQTVEDFRREQSGPIVGIHVRRSDKLLHESGFFGVEEYLYQVERWYRKHENVLSIRNGQITEVKRSLFVATDDPTVVKEIQEKYPNYKVSHDSQHTEIASNKAQRKYGHGLLSVALDLYKMVHCDYLVCTFSSNLCRLALELMQVEHGDAMHRVKSLDIGYNLFYRQQPIYHVAVFKQFDGIEGSLAFEIEDTIQPLYKIFGQEMWYGENRRTGERGRYPAHMVEPLFSYT